MTQTEDKLTREHLSNLPEGWITAALGEACIVTQGQSPPGETYNNEGKGLPFLQGKAEFGATYPNAVKWCTAPSKISEPGDVLISVRAPVGPANLCAVQSCIGRGLAAIRSQADIPAKYVLYAIRATEQELRAKSTGTTFEAIRGADLRSHIIPLAPLPEQHRIVAEIEKQLTRLDASVASLERVRANLKRYRASVLKAACEGRLVATEAELAQAEGRQYEHADELLERMLKERRVHRESQPSGRRKYKEAVGPDVSDLPPLPEGWAWATVEQVASLEPNSITDGPFGSNLKTSHYTDDGPRVIRLQNIGDGQFINAYDSHFLAKQTTGLCPNHVIEAGDLVIGALGQMAATVLLNSINLLCLQL